MSDEISLASVEEAILDQVKFVDIVLEEARKRDKILKKKLGMSYAKYVGLAAPFEELICSTRKVKAEFDSYLRIVREQITVTESKRQKRKRRSKKY